MNSRSSALQSLILLLSFTSLLLKCRSSSSDDLKTYIVYTGNSKTDEASALSHYTSLLQQVAESDATPKSILHHYKRSFNGFVVKLTEKEAERMAGLDGVVSVFPNGRKQLHTTRSWDFIGFPQQVQRATTESDVIIGVLDSGIWPESDSFSDNGLGPPPKKWKGTCSLNFPCNRKIIGAQYYRSHGSFGPNDLQSPRDNDGHGTHTASIAAGNTIRGASMLGLRQGTARGGAVSARIAVYKVCWIDGGCGNADILAAFDDAIADGVDILSVSIGFDHYGNHFRDAIAIGAFHAMRNGILTVTSAGNDGPRLGTLSNMSPWTISVAASATDRKFVTKVRLGDNRTFEGVSINTFDLKGEMYPVIYGGDAPNTKGGYDGLQSRFCGINTLDENLVKGKIVLCEGKSEGIIPFIDGAIGVLTESQTFSDSLSFFPFPSSFIDLQDGVNVLVYLSSTRNSTATIFRSEEVEDTMAPVVASFSARGPSHVSPDILKPDLVAPGVNILAGWSPISQKVGKDITEFQFNIYSGTSMSCPHVSGAAAYVKSFHPTWSPAAIQSALMTTAKPLSSKINRDAELAYGAGQIDPSMAVNPGLVYDASELDFVKFLCGQGYNTTTLQLITGDHSNCSKAITARDLNYPSIALPSPPSNSTVSGSFSRLVTNVGTSNSTYKAIVSAPPGLNVQVNPSVLSFTSIGEKQGFVVTIEGSLQASIVSASLVWSDGQFRVRSPIVVFSTQE